MAHSMTRQKKTEVIQTFLLASMLKTCVFRVFFSGYSCFVVVVVVVVIVVVIVLILQLLVGNVVAFLLSCQVQGLFDGLIREWAQGAFEGVQQRQRNGEENGVVVGKNT